MYPIEFFYRAARRQPQAIALESSRGTVSYGQLAAQVKSLAAALCHIAPTFQSRVAVCASNRIEHFVALLAILAAGKVWVPLNVRSTRMELERIIGVAAPEIVICDDSAPTMALGAAEVIRIAKADSSGHAPQTLQHLIQRFDGREPPVFDLPLDATQALKFTGGSTGMPKGVMQPYRAWNACVVNQLHSFGFNSIDRYLLSAPITHGTSTYLLPILATGGTHVFPDDSGPASLLAALRHRGITATFMPPTLIYMLMAHAHSDGQGNRFPALRHLIYGGAPMPPDKIVAARAFFGPIIEATYGQTEAPQVITTMRADEFADERLYASIGRPGLLSQVGIMSPEGAMMPAGEVGEIVVRGDLLMTGYWRMPDKTEETIVDGWLHTGDRGVFDAHGYLFMKDRLRDVIITGGFNVYPVDVEGVLGRHPAIHECAVFGVADDKWGEAIHAAVQLRPGERADVEDLMAFVKEALGSVMTPKAVYFYDDMPRTPVGKVDKKWLAEAVAEKGSRP